MAGVWGLDMFVLCCGVGGSEGDGGGVGLHGIVMLMGYFHVVDEKGDWHWD